MSVAEYVVKFEELSRFCTYINAKYVMVSRCVKFESGLRLEIYQYICFHEIQDFDTLEHKCRMFDDARKAMVNQYKEVSDKKGKRHGFGKPYNKESDCKKGESCFKCGKAGHKSFECKGKEIVCYD